MIADGIEHMDLSGLGPLQKPLVMALVTQIEQGFDLFETHSVGKLLWGYELPTFDFEIGAISATEGLSGTLYEIFEEICSRQDNATACDGLLEFLEPNEIGLFYGVSQDGLVH